MDVEAILNIPLGNTNVDDEIFWGPWGLDPKDKFSVKSAYHFDLNLSEFKNASSSNRKTLANRWKVPWKAKVLPRAKICVWRMLKNATPGKLNLWKKELLMIHSVCFAGTLRNLRSIFFGVASLQKRFGPTFSLT